MQAAWVSGFDESQHSAASGNGIRKTEAEQAAKTAPAQKRRRRLSCGRPDGDDFGLGLLSLADPSRGGDLMDRISGVRNSLAADIGIVLPKVRVRDEVALGDLDTKFASLEIHRSCYDSAEQVSGDRLRCNHWCSGWRTDSRPNLWTARGLDRYQSP